ncbi:uncharacterized protein PAC_19262 [Phialocephala subalpina]|uniref:Zn(2)-C6 fungal-type domain-containing protein n=1 Tax=Phialocephala subalpina TaxID=576137 RepID=A0A1L7XWC2_9HELO|nr:uncharacterized protein PAC_19262 [Phialocephala subalpina]
MNPTPPVPSKLPTRSRKATQGRRAPLACESCRQRKVKCSGEWPVCRSCKQRGTACVYSDNHIPLRESNALDVTASLPSQSILQKANNGFFDHFGDSVFCFLRKHSFLEDFDHGRIPVSLQLCILAVMARFVEPCYKIYGGTVEASEHFASLARSSILPTYDDINLTNMQCHLLLCIHGIGHGNEHQAWMQLGVATRIAQALRLFDEKSYRGVTVVYGETKRRIFWCCFALDRLLANGNDRPLTFSASSVTTLLPTTTQDFYLGRKSSTGLLRESGNLESDSLFASTIRIVDILGRIVDWCGAGGRHEDARCPWVPGMPITEFGRELQQWKDSLPSHMQLEDANFSAHVANSEGTAFAFIHLMYFNALCHLYREYLPLAPPPSWDPSNGPCDGPDLLSPDKENPEWWRLSICQGIFAAREISRIYTALVQSGTNASVQPLLGYCLMTSSTFHIFCFIHRWKSCEECVGEPARAVLLSDLSHLAVLQESWPVAAHWIKILRRFFEKVSSVKKKGVVDPAVKDPDISLIRAKVYHFDRSDKDPDGWPQNQPSAANDMFSLLDPETQTEAPDDQQETNQLTGFDVSSDTLLDELWGPCTISPSYFNMMSSLTGWPQA